MKIHRAATLVVLMLICAGAVVYSIDGTDVGRGSLASLAIVIGCAAVAGLAFSWRRYFPRRVPRDPARDGRRS